jgi:hypothetical protein
MLWILTRIDGKPRNLTVHQARDVIRVALETPAALDEPRVAFLCLNGKVYLKLTQTQYDRTAPFLGAEV